MLTIDPVVREAIDRQEANDILLPQVPTTTAHRFAPGVYMRSVFLPAGCRATGHEHTTTHFNILLSGRIHIVDGDKVVELTAPYVFLSEAGSKKIANVLEDTIFVTIHPTDETDIPKLEAMLSKPSQSYLDHTAGLPLK